MLREQIAANVKLILVLSIALGIGWIFIVVGWAQFISPAAPIYS